MNTVSVLRDHVNDELVLTAHLVSFQGVGAAQDLSTHVLHIAPFITFHRLMQYIFDVFRKASHQNLDQGTGHRVGRSKQFAIMKRARIGENVHSTQRGCFPMRRHHKRDVLLVRAFSMQSDLHRNIIFFL